MKNLLLLTFMFISTITYAQITGRLLDRDYNKPMVDVNVRIKNSTKGTITNALGYFQIDSLKDIDTLILSHIGYQQVTIPAPKSERFKLYMDKRFRTLPDLYLSMIPPASYYTSKKETSGLLNNGQMMIIEESADYDGGIRNFQHDLGSRLVGLSSYIKKNGPIVILFEVNNEGKTVLCDSNQKDNVKINERLAKAMNKLDAWNPGKQRGKPVPEYYKLIIRN